MRRILFVTGTRADFGKLKPLIIATQQAGFSVGVYITGMHLLEKFGSTYIEVEKLDGVDFIRVSNSNSDYTENQAKTFMATFEGMVEYLNNNPADAIVVHGDRIEALAICLAGRLLDKLILHVEGGETSGTIDEMFRHCCSKLSSHHLVSTNRADHLLRGMGEHPDRIHVIGSPELDIHASSSRGTIEEVQQHYEIPEEYGIAMLHPIVPCVAEFAELVDQVFEKISASGRNFVVIMPNNDPGEEAIVKAIRKYTQPNWRVFPTIRFESFSVLIEHARLIIGNSSAVVREAPFFGTQSICIGSRQQNRSQCPYIIELNSADNLTDLIQDSWTKERNPRYAEFGEGKSGKKFVELLLEDNFFNTEKQKYFYIG